MAVLCVGSVAVVTTHATVASATTPRPVVTPSGADSAATAAVADGVSAGNAALTSVDLAGTWSFTQAGRATTSISVPGGGWYKQGFTDVNEAVYSRGDPDDGVIDETAIRSGAQDFVAGRDNMVAHAHALTLRDRNHPAIIRWSQVNEPSFNPNDSQASSPAPDYAHPDQNTQTSTLQGQ